MRPILPSTGSDDRDEALIREALSHWASGVGILAVRDDDEIDAITVSAFTPLSLRPPLVLVCIGEQVSTLTTLREQGRFTINLLAEDAERLAGLAASRSPLDEAPFAPTGDPVLAGSLASFVCRLAADHPGGDHRIVVGEVERVVLGREAGPLLYFRRTYRGLR